MMVLKAERTANLYKVIRSLVIGDVSVAEEDTTRLWRMLLNRAREVFKPYTAKEFYQALNIVNLTYVSFA